MRWLDGKERAASLTQAIEGIAKARGAGIYPVDSLHSLVVEHAPGDDKFWWHAQPPGAIAGILRDVGLPTPVYAADGVPMAQKPVSLVRQMLRERGIECWDGQATMISPGDQLWRLVDTQWLTAHADIHKFVTGPWVGGRRCRFCRIEEPARSDERKQVDRSTASVHDACRPHWLAWLEIASRYASQKEAREADEAAGRAPRQERPTMPGLELTKPMRAAS